MNKVMKNHLTAYWCTPIDCCVNGLLNMPYKED